MDIRENNKPNFDFDFNADYSIEDCEKHIAFALYLLNQAISLKQQHNENNWSIIHACLRDATFHCEKARLFYTNEALKEFKEVQKLLFGENQ